MFIVLLNYKVPLEEVDKYLQAHREHLDYYYKQGFLLASGPRTPRTGGVIIAMTKDRAQVEAMMKEDPFFMADIADFELIDFTPVKHRDELKEIIQKMEGKLC